MTYVNQNRVVYSGTALPSGTATVNLYTSQIVRAGIASNYFQDSNISKIVLDLKNDQAGTLKVYKSPDGGTTWNQISQESIAATGATAVVHREYPTEGIQSMKIDWTNGGTVQGVFEVDVSESPRLLNPGSIGLASGAGAFSGADGVANPTLEAIFDFMMAFNGTTWDRVRSAIVAKTATFTGILNTLTLGRYNLTPPTLSDGDAQLLQLDSAGNLRGAEQFAAVAEDNTNGVLAIAQKKLAVSTYAPSVFTNLGAATTANAKATAGNLYSITCTNRNIATRYLQVFNSTGSTATVLYQWAVPGSSTVIIGEDMFTQEGWFFSTGITWGVSTTAGSYVAATASETDTAGSYI